MLPQHLPRYLLVGLLALALWSPGCGRRKLPPGVVEVEFWHSMAGPLEKSLKRLIQRFETENPKIRVRSIFQGGYSQLSQKLNLAVVNQDPPDLAQMYEAWIAYNNKSQEWVLPLDARIEADPEIQWKDIFQAFREAGQIHGKTYSIPTNKSFPVLYYNKDIFAKAGISDPPKTWDELARIGQKLTVDKDLDGQPEQWGWAFVDDPWLFECMVLQFGGSFINQEGKSALGGEPAMKAMRFLIDAFQGPKRFAYRTTGYDHQLDFADSRVAMFIGSSVSRTFMDDQIPFDYGAVPIPQGPIESSIMSGTGVALFRTEKSKEHTDAAWKFLKFLASTKATLYWGMTTNYVPIRESAVEHPDFQKRLEVDPGYGAGLAQIRYATSEPPLPAWYECRQYLKQAMEKSFLEPKNLEAIFQETVREMNRTLEKTQAEKPTPSGAKG